MSTANLGANTTNAITESTVSYVDMLQLGKPAVTGHCARYAFNGAGSD